MPNFADLRARQSGPAPIDPLDIFARLPKSADFSDLRPSQEKLLTQWHSGARSRRDNIVKLSTGGGKTLVGMLMAQSLLNELHKPVLYLSPNNQLVKQTLKDCKRYGLNAVKYAGRPHPEAFTSARAVLVANYDALFNGKSTFGLKNDPDYRMLGGIILDDAHVAISTIRKQFTLAIPNTGKPSLYWEILEPIIPELKALDRYGDVYDILVNGAKGVAEVPHWIWLKQIDRIRERLAKIPKDEAPFEWPLIRNWS